MTVEERELLESMQFHLKELGRDMADSAGAITEASLAMVQMAEAVTAITGKLNELFDEQQKTNMLIARYIRDQAKQDGTVGRLSQQISEIRKVQERLVGGER